MKTFHNKLTMAILASTLCLGFPAAYGEDTVIIDLQQDFNQQSEDLGKKLEAFHDTPQARNETKQWAKKARNATAGRERQYAHAKYVEARLAELEPRIQFLHDIRESLPSLQTTMKRLGDALTHQKTKLGLNDEAALNGTLQKTKAELEGMRVMIDQLSNDPALSSSPKFQLLVSSFRNGVRNFASRRNGDVFNTRELDKLADSVDMSRLLIEEAWMRLEDDYNRLKFTSIRGNTSIVMASAHKALSRLPGFLDDAAAEEARAMDQEMYDTSGYETDDMPAMGKQYDSNTIREMIDRM